MKAIVCTKYGPPDVLELRDVEKPTPKDNEVLVRVHAASVAMGDCELRGLKVPFEWKLLLRIGFGLASERVVLFFMISEPVVKELSAVSEGRFSVVL